MTRKTLVCSVSKMDEGVGFISVSSFLLSVLKLGVVRSNLGTACLSTELSC